MSCSGYNIQNLNEDGKKDLWLDALTSNDADLIRELTTIQTRNTNVKGPN
jgi:hypothetical protein